MTDEREVQDKHGEDAADKPSGGAKQADNPEIGHGTGEGEGGLGTQTGAEGGGEPTEPRHEEETQSREHPHGQSGH